MTGYSPGTSGKSPDRMDAHLWEQRTFDREAPSHFRIRMSQGVKKAWSAGL